MRLAREMLGWEQLWDSNLNPSDHSFHLETFSHLSHHNQYARLRLAPRARPDVINAENDDCETGAAI